MPATDNETILNLRAHTCGEISCEQCNEEREAAAEELEDLENAFDLAWKARCRAVERWKAAHPDSDIFAPDRADLIVWLLEQLDDANTQISNLRREANETDD